MNDLLPDALCDVLDNRRFRVGAGHPVRIVPDVAETCRWEIYRGNLIDPAFTRVEKTFRTWQVSVEPPEQPATTPLLTGKWEEQAELFHITRHVEIYGYEAVTTGNVIDSRPVRKWQQELVGTIDLRQTRDAATLRALLRHYFHLAVVGSSRLPITSVETPLPAYSLGLFSYDPGAPLPPSVNGLDRRRALPSIYQAKELEAVLRSVTEVELTALCRQEDWTQEETLRPVLRSLFHQVALSPLTSFVDRWLSLLRFLARPEAWGTASVLDLVGEYLRLLVRHLTAFDLHKFHNLGANYPDALFLDALLWLYLELLEQEPDLAQGPAAILRRRALRQGYLLRRMYEGHLVPDAPTSPGENARVLPVPHQPVPVEQLTRPQLRTRRLFADAPTEALLSPTTRELLQLALQDLEQDSELLELGLALFLDRPLGVGKMQTGELRDRTPLLSYIAFSRKIAQQRLDLWHTWGWVEAAEREQRRQRLARLEPPGIPAHDLPLPASRPGVICLEDMLQVSMDFLILRTTTGSLAEFWKQYDLGPLRSLGLETELRFLMRTPRSRALATPAALLTVYDGRMQPRLEFIAAGVPGYVEWAGAEYLREGLQLVRAWDAEGLPIALPSQPVILPPCFRLPDSPDIA